MRRHSRSRPTPQSFEDIDSGVLCELVACPRATRPGRGSRELGGHLEYRWWVHAIAGTSETLLGSRTGTRGTSTSGGHQTVTREVPVLLKFLSRREVIAIRRELRTATACHVPEEPFPIDVLDGAGQKQIGDNRTG